ARNDADCCPLQRCVAFGSTNRSCRLPVFPPHIMPCMFMMDLLSTRRPPPTSTLFPYTTLFRSGARLHADHVRAGGWLRDTVSGRSEEHTSELQSRENLVCRLLLEKKKADEAKLQHAGLATAYHAMQGHEGMTLLLMNEVLDPYP